MNNKIIAIESETENYVKSWRIKGDRLFGQASIESEKGYKETAGTLLNKASIAYFNAGKVMKATGSVDNKAQNELYIKALECNPKNFRALSQLRNYLKSSGDTHYNSELYTKLGEIYFEAGQKLVFEKNNNIFNGQHIISKRLNWPSKLSMYLFRHAIEQDRDNIEAYCGLAKSDFWFHKENKYSELTSHGFKLAIEQNEYDKISDIAGYRKVIFSNPLFTKHLYQSWFSYGKLPENRTAFIQNIIKRYHSNIKTYADPEKVQTLIKTLPQILLDLVLNYGTNCISKTELSHVINPEHMKHIDTLIKAGVFEAPNDGATYPITLNMTIANFMAGKALLQNVKKDPQYMDTIFSHMGDSEWEQPILYLFSQATDTRIFRSLIDKIRFDEKDLGSFRAGLSHEYSKQNVPGYTENFNRIDKSFKAGKLLGAILRDNSNFWNPNVSKSYELNDKILTVSNDIQLYHKNILVDRDPDVKERFSKLLRKQQLVLGTLLDCIRILNKKESIPELETLLIINSHINNAPDVLGQENYDYVKALIKKLEANGTP